MLCMNVHIFDVDCMIIHFYVLEPLVQKKNKENKNLFFLTFTHIRILDPNDPTHSTARVHANIPRVNAAMVVVVLVCCMIIYFKKYI